MSGVKTLIIGADEAEQRLDRWLRRRFPHVTQGRIEKMCRKGELRVDGARVKSATRVAPGQKVRVPPLPDAASEEESPKRAASAGPSLQEEDRIRSAVVFRDDHLIILNKPPGLAVQGGSKQKAHLGTLLTALSFDREDSPRLVHRLDKDTSGLLVLARTGAMATALTRLFRSKEVEKVYFAAVAGRPSPPMGTVRYALVKAGGRDAERMELVHPDKVAETPGAKHAVTDYRVVEQAGSRAAWVVMRPLTGRTHQLRAHMAGLGCPIAGDGKYGGRGQENLGDGWGAGLGGALSRKLHLHAARLTFPHPVTGRSLTFSAPLPEHMSRTWEIMGWRLQDAPEPLFEV